jgi:hypothetical protein
MLEVTPFEETLFLDNDTVVLGRLDYGFQKASQFGLAIEQTGFLPFVLPQNWNFRSKWHRSWFGPMKLMCRDLCC